MWKRPKLIIITTNIPELGYGWRIEGPNDECFSQMGFSSIEDARASGRAALRAYYGKAA